MKENSIEDRIEEKYTRYLNYETDIIDLTLEEAIFILEKDKKYHYVEDLLQAAYGMVLSDYKRVLKENEELKSDNLEYQRTQDIFDERKYRKKYLEERRSEQPKLLYPDADEIYERYYKLKEENKELKKELGRVTSGRNQLFEYATAQQVNPEMLHKVLRVEYIPKQKVKDKIEEYKRDVINLDTYPNFSEQELHREIINILQDLLEEKGE